MHPKEMSSDNSSQRYTILNFAKVSVRHRGIALLQFYFGSSGSMFALQVVIENVTRDAT